MNYSFPTHLKHQPIIGINNYDQVDGKYASDTDAMALTLGNAQWDHNDLSAKVWRKEPTKWSRQSEELPLHRVIDLATLIVSVLTEGDTDGEMKYPEGNAKKVSVKSDEEKEQRKLERAHKTFFKNLEEEKKFLNPRLEELRNAIDAYFAEQTL